MNALDIHELAALIPPMSADEYEALRSDVAKQGLIEPIITFEGKILDGRHRYEACQESGTEARFGQYGGTDPVAFVISANVHRRHLTASQKAVVALNVEVAYAKVIPKGRPSQEVSQCWETSGAAERAAQTVGVSKGYVSDAKKSTRGTGSTARHLSRNDDGAESSEGDPPTGEDQASSGDRGASTARSARSDRSRFSTPTRPGATRTPSRHGGLRTTTPRWPLTRSRRSARTSRPPKSGPVLVGY